MLPPVCKEDGRMTALLEWLDAPREMVKASNQKAGPRPTVEELQWMFQTAVHERKVSLHTKNI
jgi:hypothetical protein